MYRRDLILQGLESFWPSLVIVVVAVALIALLMRYERQLVNRRVGYMLLGLRLGVLLVLFILLLQPVLGWTFNRNESGKIIVAIDLSESMATSDEHAHLAEKLRWARALGMIGNANIDDRLNRWTDQLDNGATIDDLEWVDPQRIRDPARRQQLAETRKENLRGVFDELDRLSRKEMALRLLTATANPLLEDLNDVSNVDIQVFAGKVSSSDATQLPLAVEQPPNSLLIGTSDLGQGLLRTGSDSRSQRVLGIVMLTDGRDNAGADVLDISTQLGNSQVPVFPVILGSEFKPTDLAIARLDFPQTVFQDDKPLVKAILNTAGFEGRQIEVLLESEDAESETRTVFVESDVTELEFDLDAEELGRKEYVLRVPVLEGETRDDNNEQQFAVTVVDDSVNVVYLEGEARWEFRFIDNALTRDERVDIQNVVFDQPYLGILPDTFFERRLEVPVDPTDVDASPLSDTDLLLLGDVDPATLPPGSEELIERFVSETGGTLVVIAGKNYMPLEYRSEVFDRLLPVTNLRPLNITGADGTVPPRERGFHLKLTPEATTETPFQFDPDAETNRRIWSGLPGHLWGVLGEAKPSATVWATASRADNVGDLDAERKSAVIVHQYFGFGQVLWIGIDSTWRWRYRAGDKYHHRFWAQLARWAAENRTMAGNKHVKFGTDRTDIEVGEDAVIRARWTRQVLERFPELSAKAEIFRDSDDGQTEGNEQPFQTLKLIPDEIQLLNHEARAVSLPAGKYRIRLAIDNAHIDGETLETFLYVSDRATLELSELSSNRKLLSQIATASRGQLFFPDQVGQIADQFRSPEFTAQDREETELWDHWLILLVFFGLLTSEWVVRKVNGLP